MEEEKTVSEAVNHPSHYQSANGIEVIDVMDAFTEGLEGIEAVDTAQVIKYICRWKKKNGLEDLKKAINPNCKHIVITGGEASIYNLNFLIDELKKEGYFIQVETNGFKIDNIKNRSE